MKDIYVISECNNKKFPCKDIYEAYDVIMDEYYKSDVCIGETLNDIYIEGLCIQQVVDLFAQIMKDIEGDKLIQSNKEHEIKTERGLIV